MTGKLNLLQMSRDIMVAEEVAKKAALGWLDVEFTMYGCAYWDRAANQMYYKISARSADIYDFVEESAQYDIYPGRVEHFTYKCPVPSGMQNIIAGDVKRELAIELRAAYPKVFFEKLYQIADTVRNNRAADALWKKAEELEGLFEEEALDTFEKEIQYAYSCLKLEQAEYQALLQWLEEERKSMDDNLISKDVFEKTLYGFAYEENDRLQYVSNAQREHVYERMHELERAGRNTTQVYARQYWYNYVYRLSDVLQEYKAHLRKLCTRELLENTRAMREDMPAEVRRAGLALLDELMQQCTEGQQQTVLRYAKHWGILTDSDLNRI